MISRVIMKMNDTYLKLKLASHPAASLKRPRRDRLTRRLSPSLVSPFLPPSKGFVIWEVI